MQSRSVHLTLKTGLELFMPALGLAGLWLLLLGYSHGFESVRYFIFSADQGVAHLTYSTISRMYIDFLQESASKVFFGLSLLGFLCMFSKPKQYIFELYYALALLILLSMSPIHNNWYLLPIMPFWALSSGIGVQHLFTYVRKFSRSTTSVYLLSIGIVCIVLIQHARVYHRSLQYIVNPIRNESIKNISLYIQNHVSPEAQLVRLDANYTVTRYYSQRFTMSSSISDESRNFFLIPRQELTAKLVQSKESKYALVGETSEVTSYIQSFPQFTITHSIGNQSLAQNF